MNENVSNPDVDSPKLSFRARLTEVLDKKLNERIEMARSWFEKTYEAAEQAVYDYAKSLDDRFFSIFYCRWSIVKMVVSLPN